MTPGEVAFVLHTHLPYVRRQGVWPVGEEWLFQAWAESWLAVTDVLVRLGEEGHRDLLTLAVSPMAAHQLSDADLRRDLGAWIAAQMWQAEEQRGRYEGPAREAVRALGPFYWRHYGRLLDLHDRVERQGGLLAVWAELERHGIVELMGGPASHPYLPLVAEPALVDAQLACGLQAHSRWAGRRPDGLWAPECGYRPQGPVADPTADTPALAGDGTPTPARPGPSHPGLEEHYARHGITHFLVDAATFVAAVDGRPRQWTSRPEVPDPATGDAYELVHDGAWVGASQVVAFARDLSVAYHVWSPTEGYPGDPWYRDFHARGGFGAHPSWRVTDKCLPVAAKAPYEPAAAAARTAEHAAHLHGVLRAVLDPRPGQLVVAAYDTELFGHWWFEGPTWLEGLLRRVLADPRLVTTTLASRLRRRPPVQRLQLRESSWGYAKGHGSWVSTGTRWMWQELRRAEARFLRLRPRTAPGTGLATTTPSPPDCRSTAGPPPAAGAQAARELAIAQASDWPFMVIRGACPDYAEDRFRDHLGTFDAFCDALESGRTDDALAAQVVDRTRTVDAPRDVSAFLHAPTGAAAG